MDTTAMDESLVNDLRIVLNDNRVRVGAVDQSLFSRDASVFDGGDAGPICFPLTTAEVADCVKVARRHGRSFVARGSGTGLAGGAVPIDQPVVIVTTKMNQIIEVDEENRVAWVEPGVINLDLTRALAPHGLHFAPDPSSQQTCSVGGNVANNSGGPHCLAYGVTGAHILAVEVVLSDGEIAMLGGLEPDPAGYDLRGVFVGSEGLLGITTRIAVRLTPNPPAVATLLLDFPDLRSAATTVSAIIAAGIVPAALEMMDANAVKMVEDYVGAGYPRDAAAVLLAEVDGLIDGCAREQELITQIGHDHGANVRVAADEAERALLWKGRKTAFGAVASFAPRYYLHDTVVPRTKLVEVLERVIDIAAGHDLTIINVFHAGDGNLHPILAFDPTDDPTVWDRVHSAGRAIVETSLAAGGVLSGEHGIGIEKRDYMALLFSADDLIAQDRIRAAFDPDRVANPGKVLPSGSSCGEVQHLRHMPEGAWL
ncbi:MAG: FAD-binding protein [Actinomycetia bacterium]|nr:FAD-binding protein [Actinomycetes bacterium]MCP4085479.1 FAD-binding protein [Actinomycetes bacterium]